MVAANSFVYLSHDVTGLVWCQASEIGGEKLLLYNVPCNMRKREACTFNRLASCQLSGSVPLYKYEIIGVIQEVSV